MRSGWGGGGGGGVTELGVSFQPRFINGVGIFNSGYKDVLLLSRNIISQLILSAGLAAILLYVHKSCHIKIRNFTNR